MAKTPTPVKPAPAPKAVDKAEVAAPKAAPVPKKAEETCSVCGAVTTEVDGGVCLACRS